MEKDANAQEQELSLREELEKAEQEETETASDDSSTSKEEAPQEAEEKDEETSTLEELDDDDGFQEAKKELEQEMGGKELTFNQTKKFRKVYWEKKESDRENQKLREELQALQNREWSDNELLGETVKRGLLEQDNKPTPASKKEELNWDELYLKATPEQRQWLDIIDARAKKESAPLQAKIQEYEERFGSLSMSQKQKEIESEESVLRNQVKEKYGLDYDKDVLPEIHKLIPEISKHIPRNMTLLEAGWTPTLLANQVIAGKHFELSQKKLALEAKKLNDKKKKANVETESAAYAEPVDDTEKSFKELLGEEMAKEGLTKFE